ncbi:MULTISPECIES: hypothetical protein [unclassified Paenibacillus]|uniref:hypothetical protein n=1 Tax=unclassified Paenibacillus TaxID=185978 RepID=UPI001E33FF73|nr:MULTISPECIES: hypothetical protein [unclassified Paenibacillus]
MGKDERCAASEIHEHCKFGNPLGKDSDVFYTDLKTGKITHVWEYNKDLPNGGRWKTL